MRKIARGFPVADSTALPIIFRAGANNRRDPRFTAGRSAPKLIAARFSFAAAFPVIPFIARFDDSLARLFNYN